MCGRLPPLLVGKLLSGALLPPSESAGVRVHSTTSHKWVMK